MDRLRRFVCIGLAAWSTSACDVGLAVGIGPGDDPPSVSLAGAPSSGAPGERIGLVAAASDDYQVIEVQFWRVDADADTLLGIDGSAPYALETVLPSSAGGEVRYFARAVDDAGQASRSNEVRVTLR